MTGRPSIVTAVVAHVFARALAIVMIVMSMCAGCANARYDRGSSIESLADTVQVYGVPPVAQSSKYQCGYVCLASVALYYNTNTSKLVEGVLPEKFSGRPLSAKELLEMSKELGLIGFAYEGSLEDLTTNLKKGRPVIVLLNDPPRTAHWPSFEWAKETVNTLLAIPHWVVVIGLTPKGEFVLHDPRKGRLLMSTKTFEQVWKKQSRVSVLISVRASS
jgi:ABC-type bacteriocin/lantibiotic exporter with double-glycine peptidase domain